MPPTSMITRTTFETDLLPPSDGVDDDICTAADRHEIERRYGWWSDEPVLCEDGRATRLATLPAKAALYLGSTGDLLVVHPTVLRDRFRVHHFSGTPSTMWDCVAARFPGAFPGGALDRYWILREPVSPFVSTYAMFDLLRFEVRDRVCDRADASRRVKQANATHPPSRAEGTHPPSGGGGSLSHHPS